MYVYSHLIKIDRKRIDILGNFILKYYTYRILTTGCFIINITKKICHSVVYYNKLC